MEPWSVVSTVRIPCAAASRRMRSAEDASNHWRVSARSAAASRATSIRMVFSLRPCVSRSMKLKTTATTPSDFMALRTRATRSSPSWSVNTFS
jgi:hypothetical protein